MSSCRPHCPAAICSDRPGIYYVLRNRLSPQPLRQPCVCRKSFSGLSCYGHIWVPCITVLYSRFRIAGMFPSSWFHSLFFFLAGLYLFAYNHKKLNNIIIGFNPFFITFYSICIILMLSFLTRQYTGPIFHSILLLFYYNCCRLFIKYHLDV